MTQGPGIRGSLSLPIPPVFLCSSCKENIENQRFPIASARVISFDAAPGDKAKRARNSQGSRRARQKPEGWLGQKGAHVLSYRFAIRSFDLTIGVDIVTIVATIGNLTDRSSYQVKVSSCHGAIGVNITN
jgi:hypothetical protein